MAKFKGVLFAALVPLSVQVAAQNPQGMSEEQLRQMMQGASAMAACFQSIDTSRLEAMAEEGQQMEQELKSLCAAGERDKAQGEAMAFAMKMAASPEMEQLSKCGEMAQGMMANMPDFSDYLEDEAGEPRHVCDEL